MGWVNAKEWGVSAMSGLLGGFLGGNAKGGVLNAVMNAGKFALMGFKLGSIFGPIGAFAGLLGGAAIGGILGWFGGEKVAKSIDGVGNWLSEKWNTALEFIKTNWNTYIAEPWDKYIATPLQELGEKITTAWQNKEELLRQGWETYVIKPIDDYIITPIKTLGAEISKKWDEGIGNLKNLWTKYVTDPLEENIIQPVRDLAKWWEELKFEFPSTKPIEDFFEAIRNFFSMDFPSVKDLYNFLTGNGPAPQSSTYTPDKINVDNMGTYESELSRYVKSLSSFQFPQPRPIDTNTDANEEGIQKLKDREGFLGKAKPERYQTGEVIKDDYGRTKYTVGHGITDTFPANRNFLKLSLEEMLENPRETRGVRKVTEDDTMTRDEADKYLRFLTEQKRKTFNDQYDWFDVLDTTRQNALIDMHADLNPEEKKKILSEVTYHMEDSDWYRNQTTNRAKAVIADFAKGDRVRNVSPEVPEKKQQPSLFGDFSAYPMMKDTVRGLGSLLMADGRYTSLQKAGGYIAKDPSLIISGEYNGAGENPEVTIQMNALENRILATTRKLFDQANQKDMELLTTTYENRLKKAMSNAQQSETRVRQKEMVEQRMVQLQMPVTTSNIDNKTINNVSQPIVMQHSAKNERNYFRMA